MAREFIPKIVTANDLVEGDVVYLTASGEWSRQLSEAAVAHDKNEETRLIEIGESQSAIVVGPYLADVRIGENGEPEPAHFREAFRARGPSNYFHGKQEQARS